MNTRDLFLDTISNKIKDNYDMVIVCADTGTPTLDEFKSNHSDRFINVGIAEQNLIATAAGLASTGIKTIAYSSAPFIITRAYEIIRDTASYMNLPMTIVSVMGQGGLGMCAYGSTHYNTEDIALMRTCPNINIITISDLTMAVEVVDKMIVTDNPIYIRLDKGIEYQIYDGYKIQWERGYNKLVDNGRDTVIISNGYLLYELKKLLDQSSIIDGKYTLIDLFSFPFDEEAFLNDISQYSNIYIAEEHIRNGGIGSIVIELLSDRNINKNVIRMGLNFDSGYPHTAGNRNFFWNQYAKPLSDIISQIENMLSCEGDKL